MEDAAIDALLGYLRKSALLAALVHALSGLLDDSFLTHRK
jgi:hypothetical protein